MYADVKSRTSSSYASPGLLLRESDALGLEMLFEMLFELLDSDPQPEARTTNAADRISEVRDADDGIIVWVPPRR